MRTVRSHYPFFCCGDQGRHACAVYPKDGHHRAQSFMRPFTLWLQRRGAACWPLQLAASIRQNWQRCAHGRARQALPSQFLKVGCPSDRVQRQHDWCLPECPSGAGARGVQQWSRPVRLSVTVKPGSANNGHDSYAAVYALVWPGLSEGRLEKPLSCIARIVHSRRPLAKKTAIIPRCRYARRVTSNSKSDPLT